MHLLELSAKHGHGALAVPDGFSMDPLEDGLKVVEELEKGVAGDTEPAEREGRDPWRGVRVPWRELSRWDAQIQFAVAQS